MNIIYANRVIQHEDTLQYSAMLMLDFNLSVVDYTGYLFHENDESATRAKVPNDKIYARGLMNGFTGAHIRKHY